MASLQKEYSHSKLLGKIYTPIFIVNKILDTVGYDGEKILGKKILDPACGDGRFLIEIVKRIINIAPVDKLEYFLSFVYGRDIDHDAILECKKNLNKLIINLGISVNWNIEVRNSLKQISNLDEKGFDFIVGNPPYIRIQHLDKIEREFIQKNFKFCNLGSTDIFIAFFELAIKLMNKDGICSYISPNSYFTTETGKKLRNYFSNNKLISIIDFGGIQVFDNATTYTCITTFSNNISSKFLYYRAKSLDIFEKVELGFDSIDRSKFWQLSINDSLKKTGTRLGDVCNVYVGIATLCDKVYILDFIEDFGDYLLLSSKYCGNIKIEKSILKPIIKVSKNKKQYIIFPYKQISGKYKVMEEHYLESNYKYTYDYLKSVKHILENRSNGKSKNIKWYEFGRNQALDSGFGKKIIFSTMNLKPNFILVNDENTTFYSGYAIKYNGDYNYLLSILNSEEMEKFINISGKHLRGGRRAYSKRIIDEFIF